MKVPVRLTRESATRYLAWCPDLPGCAARGSSPEEAIRKVVGEARSYMASLNASVPKALEALVVSGREWLAGAGRPATPAAARTGSAEGVSAQEGP